MTPVNRKDNGRTFSPGKVPHDLPAGDFSRWLQVARQALIDGSAAVVPCGACTGCCTSSSFIHVRPSEKDTRAHIPAELLSAAPGMPQGYLVLGYDSKGRCPLLKKGKCSIYDHRPQTCRTYDCRVFSAAGIGAGGGKSAINERIAQWTFTYPTLLDQSEKRAVQETAAFVRDHASCFPGGRVPGDPSQLAVLAIKTYEVLLDRTMHDDKTRVLSDNEIAAAIVEASRTFDAKIEKPV